MSTSRPALLRPTTALVVALSLLLSALAVGRAVQPVTAAESVDVIVQLDGTPAAIVRSQGGDPQAQIAQLRASQDRFLERLAAAGIDATLLLTPVQQASQDVAASAPLRYYWTLNGLAIRVPSASLGTVAGMPGVVNVSKVRQVVAFLDTSVPYTGATSVWEDYGFRGEGITVADIDSGIAWDHGVFTTDPAAVPGVNHQKITKYYSFTAGLYDGNGHGTHVGGIIAADSSLGHPIPNPETGWGEALLDGVAPLATLFGYKVLSDAGTGLNASVVLAVDQAVADDADVLNLSLGSDTDVPDSPEAVAVANAMAAGHFVAVAAGNAGPGYSTIGTPATRQEILTVGSSTDPGNIQFYLEDRDGGERFAMNLMSNSPEPSDDPPVDAQYVHVGEGCTPAEYALKPVMEKVALIARGTCTFSVKKDMAELHGASAALIYNNVEGNFSGTMSPSQIVVGALSDVDGQHLVGQTDLTGLSGETVLFDPDGDARVGQVSGTSSRGPTDDYRIKPDVVAPGDSITSSVPQVANPVGVGDPSGYSDAGGTSMASPHMAGAAALMTEAHPDWTTREIRAAFMNTAVQLVDPADGTPYSIMDQGAGLVDIRAAMDTPAVIVNPSHSFGEVRSGAGTVTVSADFTIIDKSGGGTWSLAWEDGNGKNRGGEGRALPATGWSQSISPSSVTVEAGESATFTLTLTIDGSQLAEGDYEGRILATGGGVTHRVPIFAHHDTRPPSVQRDTPVLDDPGDTSTTGNYTLSWSDVAGEEGYRAQESTDVAVVLHDDAEGGLAVHWTTEAFPFGWSDSSLQANSGSQSYWSGNTDERTTTLTLAEPIPVPDGSEATVRFASFEDTEPTFDFGYLEASDDGGATWASYLTINGFSEGWVERSASLSGMSGDVLVRFRYVTDQLISAPLFTGWFVDDVEISMGSWASIGDTAADETTLLVSDQESGTYYHRVAGLFDSGSSTPATGPWSNVVDITVDVPATEPDLRVSAMSAQNVDGTPKPKAGERVTVGATITNSGDANAGASQAEFRLDDGSVIGVADLAPIPAGGSMEVTVTWDTRGRNGDHVITATADVGGAVEESDEDNNTGQLTVSIRGNRVENSSFEEPNESGSGPEGWTAEDTEAGSTSWSEEGTDGDASVTITGTGGNALLSGVATWTSEPIAVSAGEVLALSAQVRADGASTAGGIGLAWLGPSGDLLDTVTLLTAPLATDGFELIEETVTVPAGVAEVRVVLTGFAATDLRTGGSVTFDEIGLFGE